jgi:hypothetical protein
MRCFALKKAMKTNLLFLVLTIFFPLWVHAADDKPAWRTEWEKTVQAANREGQLVNYGGEEIIHPDIIKAFNAEYPEIKVTTAGGHGSELGARIVAERRGKNISSIFMPGARPRLTVCFMSVRP